MSDPIRTILEATVFAVLAAVVVTLLAALGMAVWWFWAEVI